MRRILRNLALVLFFASGIPTLRLYLHRRREPVVRVVVFHDTPNPQTFEKILVFLKRHFYIVSPDAFIRQMFDPSKINVLLTFDDGYASWHEVALPLLKLHDVGAVFFVASGFVDSAGNTEAETTYTNVSLGIKHRRALSWEHVVDIARWPLSEIGGHTRTHPNLAKLSYEGMLAEITNDKEAIEQHIGKEISLFAYPFGSSGTVTPLVERAVRESGYAFGFTSTIDFVNFKKQLSVPRISIDPETPLFLAWLFVYGTYDFLKKVYNAAHVWD